MENRITWLFLFILFALLNGFTHYQFGLPNGGLYNDRPSIPLIILSFGPWLQLIILLMVAVYLRDIDPKQQFFPKIGKSNFETEVLAYRWEKLSATAILVLPLIAFMWAWGRFLYKGEIFQSSSNLNLIERGRFDRVSLWSIWGGWDNYRYGDPVTAEGASFIPFWQPILIMGLGSALVTIATIIVIFRLIKRSRTRWRAIQTARHIN